MPKPSPNLLHNWLYALALLLLTTAAHAQGSPLPYRRPRHPGDRHWEINFGLVANRNPGSGVHQVPDIDMNYGLGDRIQLKHEKPIALSETRSVPGTNQPSPSAQHVIGDLRVGQFATATPSSASPPSTSAAAGSPTEPRPSTCSMGGRSFQTVTATNGQPSQIAYLGLQVLFGK